MVIWEKEREIDTLSKQLEAAVELPLQPIMEQSTGLYDTNVEGPLIGSQRAVLLQPIKTSPVVMPCVTLLTIVPREQIVTSSQPPGIKRTVLISVVQGNKP